MMFGSKCWGGGRREVSAPERKARPPPATKPCIEATHETEGHGRQFKQKNHQGESSKARQEEWAGRKGVERPERAGKHH